jgi:hypothetical protein
MLPFGKAMQQSSSLRRIQIAAVSIAANAIGPWPWTPCQSERWLSLVSRFVGWQSANLVSIHWKLTR